MLWFRLLRLLQKTLLPWLRFKFNNQRYAYFVHTYNSTWANERAVEIPIFLHLLSQAKTKKVLEIGNVLSHYQPIKHLVVDKYEQGPGVINQDIVKYAPRQKFDLILSISTLEHVGVDEQSFKPEKAVAALRQIRRLLSNLGCAYISIPWGYNHVLDQLIYTDQTTFSRKWFLKRDSWLNTWSPARQSQVKRSSYGSPYPNANAVTIVKLTR